MPSVYQKSGEWWVESNNGCRLGPYPTKYDAIAESMGTGALANYGLIFRRHGVIRRWLDWLEVISHPRRSQEREINEGGPCCLDVLDLAKALAQEFQVRPWDSLVPVGFEIYDGMGCQSFWLKLAVATKEYLTNQEDR